MTPSNPISASLGIVSIGNFDASSHSMTCGSISPSANSRMLRRSWFCSSVKEKSTLALVSRVECCVACGIARRDRCVSAAYSDTKFDLYSLHEGMSGFGARNGVRIVPDNDILAGIAAEGPRRRNGAAGTLGSERAFLRSVNAQVLNQTSWIDGV